MKRSTRRNTRAVRVGRIALRLAGAALVLALAGAAWVYFSLDGIVRRSAAEDTTRVLALTTTVADADVSPFRGRIGFTDFRIASPAGYAAPLMLDVPASSMDVTYGQLRSDPVHVTSVTLERPVLVVESRGGTLNLKRMVERMPPRPKPLMLVVDRVTVRDPTVVLKAGTLGLTTEVAVPVATFTLHDLGHVDADGDGRFEGAPMKDVVTRLLMALAARAADSDKLPPNLRLLLKGDLIGAAQHHLLSVLPDGVGDVLGGVFGAASQPATAPASREAAASDPLGTLFRLGTRGRKK